MLSTLPGSLPATPFERWLEVELKRVLDGYHCPRAGRSAHRQSARPARAGWRAAVIGALGLAMLGGGAAAAAQAGWLGAGSVHPQRGAPPPTRGAWHGTGRP